MATGTIPIVRNSILEKWYLADGMSESDVIAAYQFVGDRASLTNINNGTKYELTTNGVGFFPNVGIIFNATQGEHTLHNDTLSGLNGSMKAGIFSYSMVSNINSTMGGIMFSGKKLAMNLRTSSGFVNGPVVQNTSGTSYTCNTSYYVKKGILSCNWGAPSKVFLNGTYIATSTNFGSPYTARTCLMANEAGDIGDQSGFWCSAVAIYNKELTDAQHSMIAKQIISLGGFF